MGEPSGPSPDSDLDGLVRGGRVLFEDTFGSAPALVASAPGRINLIGEHTDYNGGLAMPGAIDRWVVVALSEGEEGRVQVYSEAFGERVDARAADSPGGGGGWSRLPLGVVRLFAEHVGANVGCRATISGDLPRGAGLSSSAAVEIALLNALRGVFEADFDDLELILTAQRVEHECLGVATGLMDQYTSQLSRSGSLMVIDFAATAHEYIDVDLDGWVWLLLDSKVRHELADSAYGDRVRETREALTLISRADERVTTFRDLGHAHVEGLGDELLRARLRHYVSENERVREAVRAMAAGDIEALGRLLDASHFSLRDDYAVSCPELDVLVEAARRSEECAGARMMGGGFGGCTLNLVRAGGAEGFVAQVAAEFERRFGYAPDAGVYRLVGGARVH